MTTAPQGFVTFPVTLPKSALKQMVAFVRALERVVALPAYRQQVTAQLPEAAQFEHGHGSVMMGYDFHLTEEGPRLIEINTNAGGGLFAYRAHYPEFEGRHFNKGNPHEPTPHQQERLVATFRQEWQRFQQAAGQVERPLGRIVVMDENPEAQFLYPEMQSFGQLFEHFGIEALVAGPEELTMDRQGVHYLGQRVDLLYMRHCDFYLDTPELAGLRAAYLNRTICLTPNPRIYGLMADKRRLITLCSAEQTTALGAEAEDAELLSHIIPTCKGLWDLADEDALWAERKQWVFKPVASHGSRGVVLGRSMRRNRFAELDRPTTLLQRLVPPSTTECEGVEKPMKTDFRLFAYGTRILGVTARLYSGQVTNFKDPQSGYAAVNVV
uniref:Circularly permuted type 2 ATP-grasp protein n=1 Tax=Magnetococcus massalia (strain MO-1) TaxID=451514 RepID=A0A1S7LLS6_MAGMO|nr:conserved protein of unknown function [Candidatus Magnetococcus massalia]